jgi:hypothetical protein
LRLARAVERRGVTSAPRPDDDDVANVLHSDRGRRVQFYLPSSP